MTKEEAIKEIDKIFGINKRPLKTKKNSNMTLIGKIITKK